MSTIIMSTLQSYVDDLAVSSKDPKAITDTLMITYKFKLKGTGEIEYHLGISFLVHWR